MSKITLGQCLFEEIDQLKNENEELKQMIDEQDGCNKRRLQIFDLKDKLCKELKEKSVLKKENEKLKEKIKEFENFVFEIYKDNFNCTKNWYLNELLHNYFDDLNFATDFKLQDILKESESE